MSQPFLIEFYYLSRKHGEPYQNYTFRASGKIEKRGCQIPFLLSIQESGLGGPNAEDKETNLDR